MHVLACDSAWLFATHADNDTEFQVLAKELLETSVETAITGPRDLPCLADRIAANENRLQEYGAQLSQTDHCHLILTQRMIDSW